jgi:hypothetical protein
MSWFDYVFPPLMIVLPLVIAALTPFNGKARTDAGLVRRGTMRLLIWTLAAIGAWLLLTQLIGPRTASFAWALFFPLFFVLAMPVLRAKNPNVVGMPPHDLPIRTASLTPRNRQPLVPGWTLAVMWIIWLLGATTILIITMRHRVDALDVAALWNHSPLGVIAIIGQATLLVVPIVLMRVLPMVRTEPAPMDQEASAELAELYHRRGVQRSWMFVVLGWSLLLLLTAQFVVMAAIGDLSSAGENVGPTIGLWGAILGSTIGVLGAIAGTASSIQAARINRRLRELTTRA